MTKIGNAKISFVSIVAGIVTSPLTTPTVLDPLKDKSGLATGNLAGRSDY